MQIRRKLVPVSLHFPRDGPFRALGWLSCPLPAQRASGLSPEQNDVCRPIDLEKLEITGKPFLLLEEVLVNPEGGNAVSADDPGLQPTICEYAGEECGSQPV